MSRKVVMSLLLLLIILGVGAILAARFREGETVAFPAATPAGLLVPLSDSGRQQAVQYALTHYGRPRNYGVYPIFGNNGSANCANFVSQVLAAGDIPADPARGWWMGAGQAGRRLSGCGERSLPHRIDSGIDMALSSAPIPGPLLAPVVSPVVDSLALWAADAILGARGDCGPAWVIAPELLRYLTEAELASGVIDLQVETTITVLSGDWNSIQPGDPAFFLRDCAGADWTTCRASHAAVVVGFGPVTLTENPELVAAAAPGLAPWLADNNAGHLPTIRPLAVIAAEFSPRLVIIHILYPG